MRSTHGQGRLETACFPWSEGRRVAGVKGGPQGRHLRLSQQVAEAEGGLIPAWREGLAAKQAVEIDPRSNATATSPSTAKIPGRHRPRPHHRHHAPGRTPLQAIADGALPLPPSAPPG